MKGSAPSAPAGGVSSHLVGVGVRVRVVVSVRAGTWVRVGVSVRVGAWVRVWVWVWVWVWVGAHELEDAARERHQI